MMRPCEQIAEHMGTLFECAEVNDYIRIRTPFLYPDGDVIDIYLRDEDGKYALTDLGETIRWLKMQAVTAKRTTKQVRLIQDVCQTHGIQFFRGELILPTDRGIEFAEDVTRLAQSCLRVSDLWFTFRTRSVEPITDEVAQFLEDSNIDFTRGESHPGRSGRNWPIDFHTRTKDHTAFVQVLSTGSRGASHRIAEHVLAMWHDLSHLRTGRSPTQFVSLFDDTMNVWGEEDFALVSDLSDVRMWSRPEELIRSLNYIAI